MNNSNNDESHRLLMIPMGKHTKPKKEIEKGSKKRLYPQFLNRFLSGTVEC